MASTTNQITLKLLIDTNLKKVVFAEANKDFVDFLFGLLQVPLGSIMGNLLDNEMDCGHSMARVYKSVADMESSCLLTSRDLLLWPQMSPSSSSINIPPLLQSFVVPKRKSTIDVAQCNAHQSPLLAPASPFGFVSAPASGFQNKYEGFVGGTTQFMVMDDLTVKPLSPISAITLLNTIGVKNLSSLVETNITVDFKKSLELVKASFVSDTVLRNQ